MSPAPAVAIGAAVRTGVEPRRTRAPSHRLMPRSAALRFGLAFWLLFVAILIATGAMFYRTLAERLLDHVDAALEDRWAFIETVHAHGGLDAVIALRGEPGGHLMSEHTGMHLGGAGGAWLAGDLPTGIASNGFVTLSGQSDAFESGTRNRYLSGSLGEARLTLGRSLAALDELHRVTLVCLLRALFAATLLGIVAAAALAWRARARMQLWTLALQRVAGGDLGARLPSGAANDDVDDMSAQINAVLERLAGTVEGMRQVSTDIAHDLKTPLNRLYINLEDAAQQAHHGNCGEAVLERALEEAREIDETFEALLSIARIEAGAPKARFGQFDLLEVLTDAFEVYAPVTESDAVALVLKPSGPLPMIGDRALMLQLVANLIENALRHGGSTIGSITLDGERVPGGIRLVVTDDGAGIPEPEQQKVFQRLYRLERSRTTHGTGMGLSLVRAIARLHCGEVTLEDAAPGLRVMVAFDDNCPVER